MPHLSAATRAQLAPSVSNHMSPMDSVPLLHKLNQSDTLTFLSALAPFMQSALIWITVNIYIASLFNSVFVRCAIFNLETFLGTFSLEHSNAMHKFNTRPT